MKKRILFIYCYLHGGGTEKVLMTMFNHFDYSRFDVELLLIYNEGVYLLDLPKNIKVNYLYSSQLSFLEKVNYHLNWRFNIEQGYKLLVKSKVEEYDTIVSFYSGLPLKYHSYITDKAKRNISWVHTDLINNHDSTGRVFSEEQEKDAYGKMDKIVFVSNDAKKQFEKLYPDILVSKEVILNPIEKDLIIQYRKDYKHYLKDRCFNIVSVGRLCEVKAFDRLIRLAKRLKNNNYNFHITIVGEGSLRESLECLIVENKVEDRVSLLGFFKPPYEKMSEADLFILSSLAEGYPLVLCEAFCLGLPVVATRVTGSSELIDNDKYGILTEHDDESIFQAVKKMIDDDSLRNYYHKKSLERAEILDIDAVMSKVYSVL